MALCEKQGFIPRFYLDEPGDKIDRVLQDLEEYTRTLVTEEMGLGQMIERAVKQIDEDRKKREYNEARPDTDEETDEKVFEERLFSEKEDENNAVDTQALMELVELENKQAEEDEELIHGE